MNRRQLHLTELAWAFVGFGIMCFLMGSGWSVARAKYYQLQLAEHRLAVNSVLSGVKEVQETLIKSAETSAIAPQEKQEIKQQIQKNNRILDRVEADIEETTNKLIKSTSE